MGWICSLWGPWGEGGQGGRQKPPVTPVWVWVGSLGGRTPRPPRQLSPRLRSAPEAGPRPRRRRARRSPPGGAATQAPGGEGRRPRDPGVARGVAGSWGPRGWPSPAAGALACSPPRPLHRLLLPLCGCNDSDSSPVSLTRNLQATLPSSRVSFLGTRSPWEETPSSGSVAVFALPAKQGVGGTGGQAFP